MNSSTAIELYDFCAEETQLYSVFLHVYWARIVSVFLISFVAQYLRTLVNQDDFEYTYC